MMPEDRGLIDSREPESIHAADRETPQAKAFYVYLAIAFLLLTASVSLYWSHQKWMDNDEYLSYYGDSAATVGDVVRIQLHYPISLDPPAYHILSHLSMDLAGRNETAMRLPALAGFLLFQVGLFLYVRRLAGSRAGIIALLLPLMSTMYFYSVVGRPYGLLLGLYALSLVFWQTAARRSETRERRGFALLGIALALALAITSHYFGVLIAVPICLAELARTISRRRLDYGMLVGIGAGIASILAVLPFRKGVMVYQRHYYIAGVATGVIREAYRAIFFRYDNWPALWKSALSMGLTLGLLVLIIASCRRFMQRDPDEPSYEWMALVAIGALPVFGYLFGHFVTHTMEVRYVMAWQFAAMACVGLALEKALRRTAVFWSLVAVILLGGYAIEKPIIVLYHGDRLSKAAGLVVPPGVAETILSDPVRRIYIQSLENFYTAQHYEADPRLRERFSFVYGREQELGWLDHDTNYITAENMKHFAPLSVVPYSDFLADRNPLLVLYGNGWEWIGQDLAARGRPLVFEGPLVRGKLFEVQPQRASGGQPVSAEGWKGEGVMHGPPGEDLGVR